MTRHTANRPLSASELSRQRGHPNESRSSKHPQVPALLPRLTSRVFPLGSRGAYQLPEWPADKRIWAPPQRLPCKITSAAHGTGRARDYESHLLGSAILRRDLTTRAAFPRGPRLGRSCLLNKLMGRFGPRRTGPAAGPPPPPTTKPAGGGSSIHGRPGSSRVCSLLLLAGSGAGREETRARPAINEAQVGIPFPHLHHLSRKAQRPSSPDIRRQ